MGTHTFAELEISDLAYQEISDKLRKAGYDHAFMDNGAIDMHGIGVVRRRSTEDLKTFFKQKLNEAVDKLAADHGVTRDELLMHARNLLEESHKTRLRSQLKNETHEDKE